MEFKPYENQDYVKLRNDCLSKRVLFDDPLFPANFESLYKFKLPEDLSGKKIRWARPHEIVKAAKFVVNGFNGNDLCQGDVSDCWFIAAAASLTSIPSYFKIVVPEDQSFDQSEGYCGIFHFRFWKYGQWYDVVVDDRLPVDNNGKLVFCSNKNDLDEFWGPLLEKAYAKLASCYEFIHFGLIQDALVDMTGGVSEVFLLSNYNTSDELKDQLWQAMKKARDMGSVSGALIATNSGAAESVLSNGLVNNHAYSLNSIIEIEASYKYKLLFEKFKAFVDDDKSRESRNNMNPVKASFNSFGIHSQPHSSQVQNVMNLANYTQNPYQQNNYYTNISGSSNSSFINADRTNNIISSTNQQNKKIRLVRLRNPWGDEAEWKGPWGDSSLEWIHIDPNTKKQLGLVKENDGEFWMDYNDFMNNFKYLCTIHINFNAFKSDLQPHKNFYEWETVQYHGETLPKKEDLWNNTQYFISLNRSFSISIDEESYKPILIVSLLCKDSIRAKARGIPQKIRMEIHIYRVRSNILLNSQNLHVNRFKFKSDELEKVFIDEMKTRSQEFTQHYTLEPGNYIVIPLIYFKNSPCKYYLRMFMENPMKISDTSILDQNFDGIYQKIIHSIIDTSSVENSDNDDEDDNYFETLLVQSINSVNISNENYMPIPTANVYTNIPTAAVYTADNVSTISQSNDCIQM